MKKIFFILFTLLSFSVQAQYIKPNNSYGTISNRQSIDSTLLIPTGCGVPSLRGVDLKKVALYGDTCNNLLYQFNPKTGTWSATGNGYSSATSIDSTTYSLNKNNGDKTVFVLGKGVSNADTIYINPQVIAGGSSGIIKLGDSPYGLIKLNDSTYYVDSSLLLTKLLAEGTYLKIADTTNKWIPQGSKYPISVIRPIIAKNDSTIAFDSLNLTELRYSLASRNISTDTSLTDKKYVDSSIAAHSGSGSGRVYGVNGVKNVNDSTVQADTLLLSTRAWRQKGIDSVQANINVTIISIDTTADGRYFVLTHANGVKDTFGIVGTDTSFLRRDINANTSAITLKADKANTVTVNGSTQTLSSNPTFTVSGADSAFMVLTALNLGSRIPTNKGLLLRDTTLGSNPQNSPPIIFQGRNNSATTLFALYTDGNQSQGNFKIAISRDSGVTWTTGLAIDKFGALTTTSSISVSSGFVSAGQFSGTLMNFLASSGFGVIGANRQPNPNAQLEITSTTRGLLIPVMTTTNRQIVAGTVRRGHILTGGSGYTAGGSVTFTGGSGSGQTGTITVSGGIVTAFALTPTTGKNYRVGDVLGWNGNSGTGFTFQVDAISGDTSHLVMIGDTTTNQVMIWNGQSFQGEEISSSASTLSLLHGWDVVFTGSTATYTLPAPTTSIVGRQNKITIMNLGSSSITVNSDAGSTIMPNASITPASTMTIASGASAELYPTGIYFKVLYNN